MALKITKEYSFSKVGIDEVSGLKDAMQDAITPITDKLKESIYWNDCKFELSEYRSRDGFIPYSDNCGGLELTVVIPKCESYDFDFLEFGECDECGSPELGLDRYGSPKQCGYNGDECASESEGHLDAKLRVWFKFEGLDASTGEMSFYLVLSGGNGDAPYFREKHSATIFETEFKVKSIEGFTRRANAAVKKLIKVIK